MLNSLRLKDEKEVKIKINNYLLRGYSCEKFQNTLNELFNQSLNKVSYRKVLLTLEECEYINKLKNILDLHFCKKPNLNPGMIFEFWLYYTVLEFFRESKKDVKVVRNLDVKYKDSGLTEIDLLVEYNNKIIIFECKNKFVGSNTLLKLLGVMNLLNIKNGVIATTKKFKWNLDKEEISKNCNIYILDKLLEKDKNKIFKEFKYIFKM
ncbi:NERD domain-containing protein [Methanocaldococcus indicus]|uniref:NERD domain-containing protein n=1 Tax=Methanocaldococcus indicus TaxID=213231 RepID=UPI003C6D4211